MASPPSQPRSATPASLGNDAGSFESDGPGVDYVITAQERALFLLDILNSIFSFLRPAQLVVAAQISRIWSDCALDLLWRNLPTIVPLLELLAPLSVSRESSGDCWVLPRRIPNVKWQRFQYYESKVMMLTQDDSIPINGVNIPLSPTIYSTLLLHTLRRREFLPNLRKVWWTVIPSSSSHFIVSVLHDSVIHLSITFSKVGEGIGYFLEDLQGRTKNIRTLSIKLRPSVARDLIKCQGSLIELLQQSPNLVEIFLPQFSLSPPIVVALGSLPHLKSLQLSDGGAFDPVTYDPGAKFDINASTFPMLEHLAYNSALGNAKRMFENWDRTSSLTSLCITSHGWKPGKNGVNQFLTALVKASPALSSLKLNLFMRPSENPDPLDSTDLFPLSQLHLTELKIGHNHPIILSAGDLDWMGAWTTLRVLSLNPDPLVPSLSSPPKGMGIETLSSIAALFPSLHHLGAFVSVESGFGLFSAESPLDLRVLDLGTSILPAESVDAVASFLASLVFDPDVSFRTGPSHWNPLPSLNLCREMWQEARRQMPKYARSQRRFREMFQHAKRDKRAAELKAEALKEEHAKATAELAKTKEENVILRSQVSSAEQSNYNLAQKVASLQQQLSSLGVAPNDV